MYTSHVSTVVIYPYRHYFFILTNMQQEKEYWVDLIFKGVNYGERYLVSNLGRIKSKVTGHILSLGFCGPDGRSYHKFTISIRGNKKQAKVHHVVYESFNSKPQEGMVIHHKDGNRLNNNILNLQEITSRKNQSIERTLKSGLPTGVSLNPSKKYTSLISFKDDRIYLGTYLSASKAEAAYLLALKVTKNPSCTRLMIERSIDRYRSSLFVKPIRRRKTQKTC